MVRAVAVVGPTAGGKTALALSLAAKTGGEILCCDSMQIYRGMDIGTAKPTAEETAACPHHLYDVADPDQAFSAADYAVLGKRVAQEVAGRGRLPIFCGGTGLYLDAVRTLRHGGKTPPPDPALRAELTRIAGTEAGRLSLYERLAAYDPDAAAATHPNNVRRVIRAIEICETTGKTKTELDREANRPDPDIAVLTIGIRYDDRALLYARADARVDAMMAAGLETEVRRLWQAGVLIPESTAGQAIGYKELLAYLSGQTTREAAVDAIKRATRHYIKRQMTWFLRDPTVHWLTADCGGQVLPTSELTAAALPLVTSYLRS